MDHDRGKRGGRVKALDALKRCKYVALTAALGIVLLLLPGGNEKKQEDGAPDAAEDFDRTALQEEMEEILSSLDGVGHLKLMLTVDGGSAYELARDEAQTQKRGGEDTGERTQKSETVVLGSGPGLRRGSEITTFSFCFPPVSQFLCSARGGCPCGSG